MPKPAATSFACNACGAVFRKWAGKCDECGEWGTISEDASPQSYQAGGKSAKAKDTKGRVLEFNSLEHQGIAPARISTNMSELDRVLGGGLVAGSAILVGGDPGIGKSTLLLQVSAALAAQGHTTHYVTGEESVDQVRLRAHRLGLKDAPVQLASATHAHDIAATITAEKPTLVIIDSIQTMYMDSIESAPGTVSQVRMCAHTLISACKQHGVMLILVGHVTKEGQIAGPKVLEHMVDTVLYFEGERGHPFRLLRAVKNRFGAAQEIGVFDMREQGLVEITNPSELFLSGVHEQVSGSVIYAGMEGTRPVLVEIQALVVPTQAAMPRRAVVGWDANRLSMLLAVLQARCGLMLMDKEVYLNVVGGLKISETAADLAVAAALVSALAKVPLPPHTVVFGEVGLGGEVRAVGYADARLKEAQKLGFTQAYVPKDTSSKALKCHALKQVRELRNILAVE